MTFTYKNKLTSVLALSTAFVCMWFAGWYHPATNNIVPQTEVPDAYMDDVHTLVFNKEGNPAMKIAAPKMTHYNNADTTELLNPTLTLFHKGPEPWIITSKVATATQGVDNIHFSQDVTIQHPGDNINPLTIIKTPRLLVQTIDQTAETNDLITLSQPNITVKAIGMHADLNAGNVKLLSQARGEYEPNV